MKVGLIGKKVGMTQVFRDGVSIPVTVIKIEPNYVIEIKKRETHGYDAVQMGSVRNKWFRGTKPVLIHIMKAFGMPREDIEKEIKKRNSDKLFTFNVLKEFRVTDPENYAPGDQVDVEALKVNDVVTIVGTSKGRGFQGVMKRYNFAGGPASHGSHFHRAPGSVGMCASPSRILKGKKMPGHMGVQKVTLKKIPIIDVIPEKNVVLVKGGVPGAINGVVYLQNIEV